MATVNQPPSTRPLPAPIGMPGEPAVRFQFPWGTVLTLAALGAVLVSVARAAGTPGQAVSWESAGALAAAGGAAFLVLRWLQNYVWGVVAGLALPFHPLFQSLVGRSDAGLIPEALLLIVLAATVAGWRLAFLPRFAWRSWVVAGAVLLAAGALAWPLQPRIGLVAALLGGGGLLAGSCLAAGAYRRWKQRPSALNVTAALLVALAVPAAGLFLAPTTVQVLGWQPHPALPADARVSEFWTAATDADFENYSVTGFGKNDLGRWAWPQTWVVLPLMGWGFFRSVRRGFRHWRRRLPLAWVLTLYALAVLAGVAFYPGMDLSAAVLSLTSLAVLLTVFGVADLVRGFMERLVLAPPQERDDR
jgi:hypothetical protein